MECHRIAHLGLDCHVDTDEEEFRVWATCVAVDHPGGDGAKDGGTDGEGELRSRGVSRLVEATTARGLGRSRKQRTPPEAVDPGESRQMIQVQSVSKGREQGRLQGRREGEGRQRSRGGCDRRTI